MCRGSSVKRRSYRAWTLTVKGGLLVPDSTRDGRHTFFICDKFFELASEQVMIGALIHEGSRIANTADVKGVNGTKSYTRASCLELAKVNPAEAFKNAQSYIYYVFDTLHTTTPS